MSTSLIKIGAAAKRLGVTIQTMRKWEATGELLPTRKTAGGTRQRLLQEDGSQGRQQSSVDYARFWQVLR